MENKCNSLKKVNMVLIVTICLLVGYILGGLRPSPASAIITDVQQLAQIYTSLQEIKNMNRIGNNNTYANMKVMANATGNKQLVDLINKKSTEDIVNMSQGDWTRTVKTRIEDVLMNVLGKITQKYTVAITPQQQLLIVKTRNILAGTKIDQSGAKNEGERLALTLGIYNDLFDDMQAKYGTMVIKDGMMQKQDIRSDQGSVKFFIEDEQKILRDISQSCNNSGNATLPVYIQITNQLLIQNNQLSLKILESLTDLNRAITLATVTDGYTQVKQEMQSLKYKKQ